MAFTFAPDVNASNPVDLIADLAVDCCEWLEELAGKKLTSKEAIVMMVAIALQETKGKYRRQRSYNSKHQIVPGPAVGFWQFEHNGGIIGVLEHHATKDIAVKVCDAFDVEPNADAVYEAIINKNDALACCFSRLLLFTDAKPLPELGKAQEAWDYYYRNWRPGKPHREAWDNNYAQAMVVMGEHYVLDGSEQPPASIDKVTVNPVPIPPPTPIPPPPPPPVIVANNPVLPPVVVTTKPTVIDGITTDMIADFNNKLFAAVAGVFMDRIKGLGAGIGLITVLPLLTQHFYNLTIDYAQSAGGAILIVFAYHVIEKIVVTLWNTLNGVRYLIGGK